MTRQGNLGRGGCCPKHPRPLPGTARSRARPTGTCGSSSRYKQNQHLVLPGKAWQNLECRLGSAQTRHARNGSCSCISAAFCSASLNPTSFHTLSRICKICNFYFFCCVAPSRCHHEQSQLFVPNPSLPTRRIWSCLASTKSVAPVGFAKAKGGC